MDLVQVRALAARGRYFQALEEARRLADDPALPPAERVDALLLATRCASLRGLHAEAYQHAQRAREAAEGAGVPERVTLADLAMGTAALEAGDWQAAETHLLEALARLDNLPALHGHRALTFFQLAVAYERQQRADAALVLYERAAEEYHQAGHQQRSVRAHRNAAWLLLRQGRPEEAARHLDAAALVADEDDVDRTVHLALEAAALLAQGRRQEAIQAAEEVLTPGYPGARPWSRCCAAWVAGSVAPEEGRPDLARIFLRVALKEAPDCQDTALMNLVGDLRRRLDAAE